MVLAKMKREKKCVKGVKCGFSCIKKSLVCRKTLNPSVSKAISEVTQTPKVAKVALFSKTDRYFIDIPRAKGSFVRGERILYSLEESRVEFLGKSSPVDVNEISRLKKESNGKHIYIAWGVQWGKAPSSDSEKIKTALESKKVWKEKILPTLEDGTLVSNMPDGGTNGVRDSAYRKMGFGYVNKEDLHQYAIVKNGKLEPFNPYAPDKESYTNPKSEYRDLPGGGTIEVTPRKRDEKEFAYWDNGNFE